MFRAAISAARRGFATATSTGGGSLPAQTHHELVEIDHAGSMRLFDYFITHFFFFSRDLARCLWKKLRKAFINLDVSLGELESPMVYWRTGISHGFDKWIEKIYEFFNSIMNFFNFSSFFFQFFFFSLTT